MSLYRIATILCVCNLCFYLRQNQATYTLEDTFPGNKTIIFQTGKIVCNRPWSFISLHLNMLIAFYLFLGTVVAQAEECCGRFRRHGQRGSKVGVKINILKAKF